MDLGLRDRVVLVTGASGGIGRALAEAFAEEGACVACHTFRQEEALRSWLEDQPWRDRALPVQADMRDPGAMQAATDAAVARFGRLDVCVANAGARPPQGQPLADCGDERLRATVDANLLGAVWTARAFLRTLRRTGPHPDGGGACLLLVGSTAASFGESGWTDYAAAKAGLVGLARSLRNEIVAFDPRGRVNLIEPGWTATHVPRPALQDTAAVARTVRTMPLRQIGRAGDIARAALWLASPVAARHVTGQTVTVAGGMEGRILWERSEVDGAAIRDEAGAG